MIAPYGEMSRRLRLAFVSQWFEPEPVTTPTWIARSMVRMGCDVRVLTGVPNYPSGEVQQGYSASQRACEVVSGLEVHRTPLYPYHGTSPSRRALNYLSWAGSASVFGRQLLRTAEVALVYSSPATAALPAMAARRAFGTPYVLLVQDVWPDSIFSTGMLSQEKAHTTLERVVGAFALRAYAQADQIAVTSPGMADLLAKRGVDPNKVSLVYNWVDESIFIPSAPDSELRRRLSLSDTDFLIMYAGNHGAAQSLHTAIEAMGRLNNLPDLHLVFVGEGVEKARLQRLAAQIAPANIHFLPPVAFDKIPALMAGSDIQLLPLRNHPLFGVTMPSKLQASLACGQAVIVAAPGDAASTVHRSQAGWCAIPGDVASLSQCFREAYVAGEARLISMEIAARQHYIDNMSEAVNATRLRSLLLKAARHPPADVEPGAVFRA